MENIENKTLEERLDAMAEESGLPEWMRKTVREVSPTRRNDFEDLHDELRAMSESGVPWDDQLKFVDDGLCRLLGNPATRHLDTT